MLKRCGLALLLVISCSLALAQGSRDEQLLLAVFLGRFASDVDWPPHQREVFSIGVTDDDALAERLEQLYADKRIQGRPVRIHRLGADEQITAIDLLFIASSQATLRQRQLDALRLQPVLTVSAARGFAASGGVIQINFVAQHAQITINHDAALAKGLRISAPLLAIATLIGRD